MKRFLVHQCVQLIVVCLGISIITFLLLHLKGDPVTLLLPLDAGKEEMASFRRLMGFDQPLYVQYVRFLLGAIRGNFGMSLYMKKSAFALVLERMPATLLLTFAGLFLSLVLAIPLGIVSAMRPYSLLDNLCTTLAVGGQAMPIFWLGIMLIILFSVRLHWLPASGFGTWSHLVLPATTLGFFLVPLTMRLVRSGMLEVPSQDCCGRRVPRASRSVTCYSSMPFAMLPSPLSPSSGCSSDSSWGGRSSQRRSMPGLVWRRSRSLPFGTLTFRWCRRQSFYWRSVLWW